MNDTVERELMEYDLLVVGGGPAGLACAIRARQLDPALSVCVLEKGSEIGAHSLSGCVMEPGPLDALLPDWREASALGLPVSEDALYLLSGRGRTRLPTPPQQRNHGNLIISLGQLCRYLGERAEALGVDLFPGFPAATALFDESGERVVGMRCGDMGLDAASQPGPNFAAGVEIKARCTVLAEGCRGSVSKRLIEHFALDAEADPQTYGLGMKELWQLPPGRVTPGRVEHSLGWPLDRGTYGGSFIYHLTDDQAYVGFVVALDYSDPEFSPFEAFQQFKHHPSVRRFLDGGEIISAGARTVVEGGWQSLPRLEMPGALLAGDAGGLLNVPKVKGVHQAIRSGVLAAEHLHATGGDSAGFDAAWRASDGGRELRKVRNIRPGFHRGLWWGLINAAWETLTLGLSPWTLRNHADHSALRPLAGQPTADRGWLRRELPPRDRLASVYFAATAHEESQPDHLKILDPTICVDRCTQEFGNPCTRFCPAGVYEMVETDGQRRLQINAANCVHCKACDIKDPYQIIDWVPPEGGSGPNYQKL
jgi:electron-transferring-flavoprotein dehydrogenase